MTTTKSLSSEDYENDGDIDKGAVIVTVEMVM